MTWGLPELTLNAVTLVAASWPGQVWNESPRQRVSETRSLRSDSESIARHIADDLRKVTLVEAVYSFMEGQCLRLWVVLDGMNDEIEDAVYRNYLKTIERLDWDTDLTVIFREGRDLASLLPTVAREIPAV